MKNYKVGDTVYLKAFVANVDKSDPEKTYGVNFVRGMYGVQGWPDNDAIIDELPTAEPVKPVLPKGVAEELEDAKKTFHDFYAYLDSADRIWQPKTYTYVFSSDTNRDAKIKILSDAWYNGYTVEQVPRYMVYVPGTNKHYLYVKRGSWAKASNKKITPITPQFINNYLATSSNHRDLYWFTDEEINKFNLQDCEKELVTDDSED